MDAGGALEKRNMPGWNSIGSARQQRCVGTAQLSFPCGEQHPAAQCAVDVQDGGRETELYAANTWNFMAERTAANVVVIESKVAGQ